RLREPEAARALGARAHGLRRCDGAHLGGDRQAARARGRRRVARLPAAERRHGALHRERRPAPPAPQAQEPPVLPRARGALDGLGGRGAAAPRREPAPREVPLAAVRRAPARRAAADLPRGGPLLRRTGVEARRGGVRPRHLMSEKRRSGSPTIFTSLPIAAAR